MTKPDIIAEMEAKGAVNVKDMGFDGNLDYNDNEIHPIKYRRELGADQHSEPETLYLVKQADGSFVYQDGKPGWMKDVPELRPFHFDEATIKQGLETANAGWEVIQVRQRRDGVLDEVTIDYIENDLKKEITYVVWERPDGTKDYKEVA